MMAEQTLGAFLKDARQAVGYTLRQVEEKTDSRVKNGYLSQVENDIIKQPAPATLWELAELYGLDYNDLLTRAGHREAMSERPGLRDELEVDGIPLRALQDLTDAEKDELRNYLHFIKSRRKGRGAMSG